MHTLLIRLEGPQQSWGTQSRFVERDTGLEPSKSGVIGLICAALGWPRDQPLDPLPTLLMGVRVDREGVMRRDYQTAQNVAKADGSKPGTVVSNRYYLADASFLVAISGTDETLLQQIDASLERPQWPLFLGRKAFVPATPVRLPDGGMRRDVPLRVALQQEPWRARPGQREKQLPQQLRLVVESSNPRDERRMDQPAPSATFATREYVPRYVATSFVPLGTGDGAVEIGEVEDD